MHEGLKNEWKRIAQLRPELVNDLAREVLKAGATAQTPQRFRAKIEQILEDRITSDASDEYLDELIGFTLPDENIGSA